MARVKRAVDATPKLVQAGRPRLSSAELKDRMGQLADVSAEFKDWKPAAEVLTNVQAVPTIFPQCDYHMGVFGWPTQRVSLLHGPSNHGKTSLAHGLGLSFLENAHYYFLIDAEYTTPEAWLRNLMRDFSSSPGFMALRPRTYEQTVDAVRSAVEKIADLREKGKIHPDTTSIVVVDSLQKLVPKNLLEKLKTEKGGIDGMKGRAAMYKAALNSQWLNELIPLLYHTNSTMVFIARESENTDPNKGQFDPDFKIGGGKGLIFDSSIGARVSRAKWIYDGDPKAGAPVVGERHRVSVWKTKIAGKQHRTIDWFFHTSNGVLVPEGFDRARDCIELGIDLDVIEQSGSWFKFDGYKVQGEAKLLKKLYSDKDMMIALEGSVYGAMSE